MAAIPMKKPASKDGNTADSAWNKLNSLLRKMMMKKLANNKGLNDNCSGKQLINTTYIKAGRLLTSRKTLCLLITEVRKRA